MLKINYYNKDDYLLYAEDENGYRIERYLHLVSHEEVVKVAEEMVVKIGVDCVKVEDDRTGDLYMEICQEENNQ